MLSHAAIVELWEAGRGLHPVDQALAVLGAAGSGRAAAELAALPLGERDARLLAIRESLFGDCLSGCAHCPDCDETAEFELSCRTIAATSAPERERSVQHGSFSVRVRPPDSFDLAAAAESASLDAARALLLQRCLVDAHRETEPVTWTALPDPVREAAEQAVLAADPGAETLLDLVCPQCGRAWQVLLDIVHILWLEIAARAQRLLLDVHLLASAYGWREADILAMSGPRRAAYLGMVAA